LINPPSPHRFRRQGGCPDARPRSVKTAAAHGLPPRKSVRAYHWSPGHLQPKFIVIPKNLAIRRAVRTEIPVIAQYVLKLFRGNSLAAMFAWRDSIRVLAPVLQVQAPKDLRFPFTTSAYLHAAVLAHDAKAAHVANAIRAIGSYPLYFPPKYSHHVCSLSVMRGVSNHKARLTLTTRVLSRSRPLQEFLQMSVNETERVAMPRRPRRLARRGAFRFFEKRANAFFW
jgi:hypothetical protein